MTKIVTRTLIIFSVFLFTGLSAQNVYFTGLGRALVSTDRLSDQTNTASKLKGSGGYTLFDLGINGKSGDVLRGSVILRIRNEFGGFFGDGSSLQFRQMQLEGTIAKKVKYDIGDIYLSQTQYTLWNEEPMYSKYEANVFSMRRDIVNYENFFVGNNWRMQGINAKSKITFTKGAESLSIRGYAGRTRQTDFTSLPERYFFGGRLDLVQSKYLRIAGNMAGISDIQGTVKAASVDYTNVVYTTDFDLMAESEKLKFALKGEAGISRFELKRALDSSDNKFNDYFYDLGGKATYKPLNINLAVSYRNVGFNFNSPMAQTRRVGSPDNISPTSFTTLNDNVTNRYNATNIGPSMLDFYSQESKLYNQAISTTLMKYYVQYDMVQPYGKATPNRKGFTFSADIQEPKKILNASFEANLLSEIVSEGDSITQALRKFNLMRGGLVFNVNKLIGFEKLIAINSGIRTESSIRKGTNPVNLASTLIDLGLDVEVVKDLHLLGGAKMFAVKGTEYQTGRDAMNQINKFGTGLNFNQKQSTIATGIRYDYGTNGYFSMHYHIVKYDASKEAAPIKYNWHQWFFVFGLKF